MEIDIKDLIGSIQAIQSPATRIGLPDDPTPVGIADPQLLAICLDSALCAFRALRGGADFIVRAKVNTYHRAVWIRFVQCGPCQDRTDHVEPALRRSFHALRTAIQKSQGELHYWDGNNYFDLSIPFHGPMRESLPEVRHLPWDERYRYLLERAAWESLREKVYRYSNLAELFAARCAEFALSRVFIPSVGLCVHPWLFADHGRSVIATDAARSALEVLCQPDLWLRLYSRTAFDKWDIAESADYATQGNPEHFTRMPDLEDLSVRELLRKRITFLQADWANLPLEGGSVDAIFATNALPRDSSDEQFQVLKEWVRVVRPGGLAFIAQHNFFNFDVESVLRDAGWVKVNVIRGERPDQPNTIGFHMLYSSG